MHEYSCRSLGIFVYEYHTGLTLWEVHKLHSCSMGVLLDYHVTVVLGDSHESKVNSIFVQPFLKCVYVIAIMKCIVLCHVCELTSDCQSSYPSKFVWQEWKRRPKLSTTTLILNGMRWFPVQIFLCIPLSMYVYTQREVIMVYDSMLYVGMTPKETVATLKVYRWHAWNDCIRVVNGLHEPYQALSSASMGNRIINFAGEYR